MRLTMYVVALTLALAAGCADEDTAGARATVVTVPGLFASTPRAVVVQASAVPSTAAGRPTGRTPVFYRYEVQDGDTMESVARRFGLAPTSVRWNNESVLASGEPVRGVLLEIPSRDGILHRVQRGETLTEIAARYGVEVQAIIDEPANGLQNPPALLADGVLLVPGGRRPSALSPGDLSDFVCRPAGETNRVVIVVWHEVEIGETLAEVARPYCLRTATVAYRNPDAATGGTLPAGLVLALPSSDGRLYGLGEGERPADAAARLGARERGTLMAIHGDGVGAGAESSETWLFVPND